MNKLFDRIIKTRIERNVGKNKAIIVTGARQVGKTTLIKTILKSQDYLFLDGDDPVVRNILSDANTEQLKSVIGIKKIVFIDEAQRIKNIGLTLKIITDQFNDVQLYVSGSSSFYLGDELNEPLTGRKFEYELFPIAWEELEASYGYIKSEQQLNDRLIYGFYPDVLNNQDNQKEI